MAKDKLEKTNGTGLARMSELDDIVGSDAMGFNPQMVRIKIDHQGAQFTIPGLPATKRMKGIFLASEKVRVFFPKMGVESDTEAISDLTDGRPFCSSRDYIHGTLADVDFDSVESAQFIKSKIAEGALNCIKCPMNQWGSVSLLGRDGNGKCCSEFREVLFWQAGITIPVVLRIPPSSVRVWDNYCSSLQIASRSHSSVVTEVSAELQTAPGMKWSTLTFTMADTIDEEALDELLSPVYKDDGGEQPLAKALIDIFKHRQIEVDVANGNGNGGDEL